ECHGLNPEAHRDNFAHMGFKINIVVSPQDCAVCHPVEARQYGMSKKAYAVTNLSANPVYSLLVDTIIGKKEVIGGKVKDSAPSAATKAETCYGCHGTEITVDGMKEVSTRMGRQLVPNLKNWPNQGVGRINPDGSRGSCASCHPRHGFSIEVARKPYTCAQCHLEPDVPAWDVYKESKHGNIFFSQGQEWDFKAVPWKIGKDFNAPTCAACHNALITTSDGRVIAERTHDFGARLWVRLFSLIYSHPQPKAGDTSLIRNKDGLPLPTAFTGEPATPFLITDDERLAREKGMKGICQGCHSTSWADGHFAKLDNSIQEVDAMTKEATSVLGEAWRLGLAEGLPQGKNPFDEVIEKKWIKQWLFYANSIKYASAMTGAPDYAAFKNGWWYMSENLKEMVEWVDCRKKGK
ncbi:MAG: multiheme c-type cytochrome, partial [Smithellaceae bacterium]|nr:multiheme c-type cytochrome [Smithellaceae bacterium]